MSDVERLTQVSVAIKKLQAQAEVAYKEFDNLSQLISPILNPNSIEEVGLNDSIKSGPCAPQCSLAEAINSITSQLQNLTNRLVYTNGRIEL